MSNDINIHNDVKCSFKNKKNYPTKLIRFKICGVSFAGRALWFNINNFKNRDVEKITNNKIISLNIYAKILVLYLKNICMYFRKCL